MPLTSSPAAITASVRPIVPVPPFSQSPVLRSVPMGFLVVVLLAALWAGILLPSALRARRYTSPITSIDDFERSMVMLAPTRTLPGRQVLVLNQPRAISDVAGRARTLRRRRVTLTGLGGFVVLTGLGALILGGGVWVLFLLAVALLVTYVGLLAQLRANELRRQATVRRLPVSSVARPERAPGPRRRAV